MKIIRATTIPKSLDVFCRGILKKLSEKYEVVADGTPYLPMEGYRRFISPDTGVPSGTADDGAFYDTEGRTALYDCCLADTCASTGTYIHWSGLPYRKRLTTKTVDADGFNHLPLCHLYYS